MSSSNFTSWYKPKRTETKDSKRYLYTNVHSSIIHNSQKRKQSKHPSIDEWINKIIYIYV